MKKSSNPYQSYDVVTVRSVPNHDFLTQLSELEIENFMQLMEEEFLLQEIRKLKVIFIKCVGLDNQAR